MEPYGPEEQETGRAAIFFLDGRRAYTDEEIARALKEGREAKDRAEKLAHQKHMNLLHPKGLAVIKEHDGSIAKPGGRKPWMK